MRVLAFLALLSAALALPAVAFAPAVAEMDVFDPDAMDMGVFDPVGMEPDESPIRAERIHDLYAAHKDLTGIMAAQSAGDYDTPDYPFVMTYVDEENEELVVMMHVIAALAGIEYEERELQIALDSDVDIKIIYGVFEFDSSHASIESWEQYYAMHCTPLYEMGYEDACALYAKTLREHGVHLEMADITDIPMKPDIYDNSTTHNMPVDQKALAVYVTGASQVSITSWEQYYAMRCTPSHEYGYEHACLIHEKNLRENEGRPTSADTPVTPKTKRNDHPNWPFIWWSALELQKPPYARSAPSLLPPTVYVPKNIFVTAAPDSKVQIMFTSVAHDAMGNTIEPVCLPPSGATFGFGSGYVICTATDAMGIQSSATFDVVMTPEPLQEAAFLTHFEYGIGWWNEVIRTEGADAPVYGETNWRVVVHDDMIPWGRHQLNRAAEAYDCPGGCAIETKPTMDLSNRTNATLKFAWHANGPLGRDDSLSVQLHKNGSWHTVYRWFDAPGGDHQWAHVTYPLDGFMVDDFKLRFVAHLSTHGRTIAVDSVMVRPLAEIPGIVQRPAMQPVYKLYDSSERTHESPIELLLHGGSQLEVTVPSSDAYVSPHMVNAVASLVINHNDTTAILVPSHAIDITGASDQKPPSIALAGSDAEDPGTVVANSVIATTDVMTNHKVFSDAALVKVLPERSVEVDTVRSGTRVIALDAFGATGDINGRTAEIFGAGPKSSGDILSATMTVRATTGQMDTTLIDQAMATYRSTKGDSGSPVLHVDDGGASAFLGMHIGRIQVFLGDPAGVPAGPVPTVDDNDNSLQFGVFSKWEHISRDLGLTCMSLCNPGIS